MRGVRPGKKPKARALIAQVSDGAVYVYVGTSSERFRVTSIPELREVVRIRGGRLYLSRTLDRPEMHTGNEDAIRLAREIRETP